MMDDSLGTVHCCDGKVESVEVGLPSGRQAAVPHPAIRVHMLWRCDDLWNGKVDVVCIANTWRDATEPSKGSMYLKKHSYNFLKFELIKMDKNITLAFKWLLADNQRNQLTAFCPSTVQRIASDAFARQARTIYVGSMYFKSAGTPMSLKCFLICKVKPMLLNNL